MGVLYENGEACAKKKAFDSRYSRLCRPFYSVAATAARSFGNSLYYIKEMLVVLPVIFLLTVVIEAWVPKEVIMKRFGDNSVLPEIFFLLLGAFRQGLSMRLSRSAKHFWEKGRVSKTLSLY